MARLADVIHTKEGLLSMVGTPIGNLGDMSCRAQETLASSDLILCEDTRVTSKLLNACKISVPLERCDQNIIVSKLDDVIEKLQAGAHISFVSDAGMPGISDPGQDLVNAACEAGIKIEVVPGPTALISALVASGLSSDHFFFEGFLPRKTNDKQKRLELLKRIPSTLIIYESPHRVLVTFEAIQKVMPTRQVALVREITKLYEETVRGSLDDVISELNSRTAIKGECVIVISEPSKEEQTQSPLDAHDEAPQKTIDEAISEELRLGKKKSAIARYLAKHYKLDRALVYDKICSIADAQDE